ARKRGTGPHSNYVISTNVDDLSRDGEFYVGHLKGHNLRSSEYSIYDNRTNPENTEKDAGHTVGCEIAAIIYVSLNDVRSSLLY
ncbi:unnamed protein product, partial [Didymodactylos carnosus]